MPSLEIGHMAKECTAEWLKHAVEFESALVLDCRSQPEHQASRIISSVNVNLPPLLMRRLKKGNLTVQAAIQCNEMKERFCRECKYKDVVIYGNTSGDINANASNIVSCLVQKLLQDGCNVRLLSGGFQEFQKKYPDFCSNDCASDSLTVGLQSLSLASSPTATSTDTSPSPGFPVEVIKNLYLGNAKNSVDSDALKKHNIKYILNVTPNLPNHFENDKEIGITYKQIPINDHWSQNLSLYFPEALAFIDEGRSKGCSVLVHCLAGISRSVTVTVAYLMSRERMSLNDAYDYVKKVKPDISPNFNFMGQLLDFEQSLKLHASCTCVASECKCEATAPRKEMFFMTPTKSSPNYELENFSVNVR